jgi:Na+-transporting methylmalonyl-CoA/oxaloacetate decarboxylase gamma subunit
MKKLVFESLNELFEAKKAETEDKVKTADVKSEHAKTEKSKAVKPTETKNEKAKQAIAALEAEKKKAQKPGNMKQTPSQKKANIEAIQKKIDAWRKKLE